ncbi:hypothetical protein EBZ39_13150 [bacterium]|nr:hypothetical protein [bacterium]
MDVPFKKKKNRAGPLRSGPITQDELQLFLETLHVEIHAARFPQRSSIGKGYPVRQRCAQVC